MSEPVKALVVFGGSLIFSLFLFALIICSWKWIFPWVMWLVLR